MVWQQYALMRARGGGAAGYEGARIGCMLSTKWPKLPARTQAPHAQRAHCCQGRRGRAACGRACRPCVQGVLAPALIDDWRRRIARPCPVRVRLPDLGAVVLPLEVGGRVRRRVGAAGSGSMQPSQQAAPRHIVDHGAACPLPRGASGADASLACMHACTQAAIETHSSALAVGTLRASRSGLLREARGRQPASHKGHRLQHTCRCWGRTLWPFR